MTNEELNTALYEKLFAEQQNFKGWLVKQPPEEILKHAYEYVIREDIVIEMEYHDLTDDEAKALLADEKPLQAIFSVYENTEGGHMDEIRDCIESRAKTCMENQCEALRNLPVYIFSATFAKGHGELEEYRASFKANVACRDAIEDAIASHYADNRLDGSCVQEVVDRFGAERVSFVLANTIQHKDWDGRISPENKEWAKGTGVEMMPIQNVFNEWHAQQTSKKIRAVWQNKRDHGERVSATVPYGYKKAKKDTQWYIDEPAAEIVRYIFKLAMEGLGPTKIANRLREEKYITPTEYYYQINRKTRNERPVDPYNWQDTTVKHILDNPQYTGCTVNGRSSIVSYKVHKKIEYDESEWQIIPNTQEAIVDEETFKTVHEIRASRRRNTATGRTSLFSNLVFCGDCGSKMYFCASKSINENQEFFRCSAYKENRGTCTIHFIRNVVLEEMVMETVRKTAKYISENETVFLYLYEKNHRLSVAKELRDTKLRVEQAKKRIKELDGLISASFEQLARGTISEERFKIFCDKYEAEQKELTKFVSETEAEIQTAKQDAVDLKAFLENIRECTDIQKLTPTLVNTLIKKIEIFNSVKGEDGKKHVPITIHFRSVDIVTVPDEEEIIAAMEEIRNNPTKVA